MKPTETSRTCRHCDQSKPLSQFPIIRGKQFWKCKACTYALTNSWAQREKERATQIKKRYVSKNPERRKSSILRYSRSRKGVQKLREYKTLHREQINANYRRKYAEDPEPFVRRNLRRDILERSAPGSFTKWDEFNLIGRQDWKCANPFCGVDLRERTYHIDHIVPLVRGGSHDPSNRQILCGSCNQSKSTRTNEEWNWGNPV